METTISTDDNIIPATTPTFDMVLGLDGEFADERELRIALYADGVPADACYIMVAQWADERDAYWAEQQAAEIWAEGAAVRYAENVGWEETLAEEQYDRARGVYA